MWVMQVPLQWEALIFQADIHHRKSTNGYPFHGELAIAMLVKQESRCIMIYLNLLTARPTQCRNLSRTRQHTHSIGIGLVHDFGVGSLLRHQCCGHGNLTQNPTTHQIDSRVTAEPQPEQSRTVSTPDCAKHQISIKVTYFPITFFLWEEWDRIKPW